MCWHSETFVCSSGFQTVEVFKLVGIMAWGVLIKQLDYTAAPLYSISCSADPFTTEYTSGRPVVSVDSQCTDSLATTVQCPVNTALYYHNRARSCLRF